MEGDEWLAFPDGAFEKEYWIHPTREAGWIRTRTEKTGKWAYSGTATLRGADGKPRMVCVCIEGKKYLRHRLIALAKDGTAEGLAKFRDWKNNPVLHRKRRLEDERPDDTPENVTFGTHATNRTDPNRKKQKTHASGHPVILTDAATGATEPFASALAAAEFLGVHSGSLCHYLNGTNGVKRMPKCAREGTWDAAYDEFELPDSVRLVRAAAELYLSPSRPNRLFRKLPTGKFATTELERFDGGYVQVPVVGGGTVMLHRLVVETLMPNAFDAKMATLPTDATKMDLQVDHLDGDERNNAIDNLEVLTKREHARKHALAIEWIDASGKVLETFECGDDVVAAVRGTKGQPLCGANVHKVCDRRCAHTGGRRFRWKDAELVASKRAAKKAKR